MTVNQNIQILSLSTRPHAVLNSCDFLSSAKHEDILKYVEQNFHCIVIFVHKMEVNRNQNWLVTNILKISFYVLQKKRRKSHSFGITLFTFLGELPPLSLQKNPQITVEVLIKLVKTFNKYLRSSFIKYLSDLIKCVCSATNTFSIFKYIPWNSTDFFSHSAFTIKIVKKIRRFQNPGK